MKLCRNLLLHAAEMSSHGGFEGWGDMDGRGAFQAVQVALSGPEGEGRQWKLEER
jgi:hypothetical protein